MYLKIIDSLIIVNFPSEREGRQGKRFLSEEDYELDIYEDYYDPEYYFEEYEEQSRARREAGEENIYRKKRKKEKIKTHSTAFERKTGRSKNKRTI